jgi:type VI protein secretion system component VasK
MGYVCPNAAFKLSDTDRIQLSHTEKQLLIFIPLNTVALYQPTELKSLHSWLLNRKKTHPLVSVALLVLGAEDLFKQVTHSEPDIHVHKRAIFWAESVAKKQLQRSLHFQFMPPTLNLPSLVLSHRQLSANDFAVDFERWRTHCLHTIDCSPTPWTETRLSAWLFDQGALCKCVLQWFFALSSAKRHGRACPPDAIALHAGKTALSADAVKATCFVKNTSWLNEATRRRLLFVSLSILVTVAAYASLGLIRQSIVSNHIANFENHARELNALSCSSIDSLEIADAHLQTWQQLGRSHLKFSAFLFKRQTIALHKASSQLNQSVQHWSQRCLLSAVESKVIELMEQYLSLATKQETVSKSHEQAYQFLKSYLMLFQLKHLNTQFLKAQSVHILKSVSEDKKLRLEQVLQQQRADRLLTHALEEPALSFPAANTFKTALVNEVRKTLLANQGAQNAEAQIFGRIIDSVNSQVQSVGLLSEIGLTTHSYFDNTPTILGAYAKGAFKSHVQALIVAAAKGDLEENDWVLDSPGQHEKLKPSKNLQVQLEARYWKAFELTWASALQSLTLKTGTTNTELSSLLALFADELLSPCKRVIQMLHGHNADSLFNTDDPAYRNVIGVVQQGPESPIPFSVYARALQNLTVLTQSQAEAKPDEFFSQHWSESEGASAAAHDWVQRQLIVTQSKPLQDALKQFYLLPVQFWMNRQLQKNGRVLNTRWATDVLPRLKAIHIRYPFNPRGIDATGEEMTEFLSVNQGVVSGFIQHNLKGVLKAQGDQWKVVKRFGQPPPFDTDFLALVNHLGGIRSSSSGHGFLAKFELRAIPNPLFIEQYFSLEGQQLRYRNGPQVWSEFLWRGEQPQHLTRLSAQTTDGESCAGPSWTGRMSWARALETAHIEKSGSDWVLSWFPCAEKSKKISFQYRHLQGLSPGDLLLLNHWPIPPRIFKEASF